MRANRIAVAALVGLMIGLVSVPATADRPEGKITGWITDAETGQPISGAWVAIAENNVGATTDSLGYFEIENVAPGRYTLIVTHAEYGTVSGLPTLAVSVDADSTATARIHIARAASTEPGISNPELPQIIQDRLSLNGVGLTEYDLKTGPKKERRVSTAGKQPGDQEAPSSGDYGANLKQRPIIKCPPYSDHREYSDDYGSLPPYDMFFRDYGTNRFVDPRQDRFSTFAVDVDDASYTLVRRYLQEGNIPPAEAVRVEEFINHFDYGYNNPSRHPFRVFTEITDSPFERGMKILKIGVKGRELDRRERRPLRLTFVIDVSGSMGYDNRMELVKESLRMLVKQLGRHDQVGIVAYGSRAYIVLEPVRADRGREIFRAIDGLRTGGSTFAEAGLKLGYRMANRQYSQEHNNMVVLCSDGVANVGRTSPEAIMREITRFGHKGITLSSFGFGMGNYNDVLLEQLAQKGNGRYAYVNDRAEARKVFVENFSGTTQLLARDMKVQVEFDSKVVKGYRLLGYENRDVADHRFRDNSQDGGEVGAGHEVTALYELELKRQGSHGNVATISVRWKEADRPEVAELSRDARLEEHFQSFGRSRPEMRLAMVAGRFAELLKGTAYAAETSYQELYRVAKPLRRQLPSEQTDELLDLIRLAGELGSYHTTWRDDIGDDYRDYKK